MATISKSLGLAAMTRNTRRPMRPNPLIPTRTAMEFRLLQGYGEANRAKPRHPIDPGAKLGANHPHQGMSPNSSDGGRRKSTHPTAATDSLPILTSEGYSLYDHAVATVAQSAEHRFRKAGVKSSTLFSGSRSTRTSSTSCRIRRRSMGRPGIPPDGARSPPPCTMAHDTLAPGLHLPLRCRRQGEARQRRCLRRARGPAPRPFGNADRGPGRALRLPPRGPGGGRRVEHRGVEDPARLRHHHAGRPDRPRRDQGAGQGGRPAPSSATATTRSSGRSCNRSRISSTPTATSSASGTTASSKGRS